MFQSWLFDAVPGGRFASQSIRLADPSVSMLRRSPRAAEISLQPAALESLPSELQFRLGNESQRSPLSSRAEPGTTPYLDGLSPPALAAFFGCCLSRNCQLRPIKFPLNRRRHHMAHWRKAYQPTSQFNSLAGWAIGTSMLVGVLVFIAKHVYI